MTKGCSEKDSDAREYFNYLELLGASLRLSQVIFHSKTNLLLKNYHRPSDK